MQEGRLGGGHEQTREATARDRQARGGTTVTGHSISSDEATYSLHAGEMRGASPANGASSNALFRCLAEAVLPGRRA